MPAPVYVTFRHMHGRAELQDHARLRAARLEQFSGRIVDCRVVLEARDAFRLRALIEVTVPGQRLVTSFESNGVRAHAAGLISRAPQGADWIRVLDEGFDAAERLLQTYTGRRRARARIVT